MVDLPNYVPATFLAIVIVVAIFIIFAFRTACQHKKKPTSLIIPTVLVAWILFVSFYTYFGSFGDYLSSLRLILCLGIMVLATIILFIIPSSRAYLSELPITTLHYVHIVRLPMEMILWWLGIWSMVPLEMTFEGSNLDILSGISAPFATVFMVSSRSNNRLGAVIWNLVALGLLINMVVTVISYTPNFYLENQVTHLGVFQFPYILLPTFVIPVILFCHLVAICQLTFKKGSFTL